MSHQTRYHIQLKQGRTTISVDTLLSELLALHLGHAPDDPQAAAKVRQWLQNTFVAHLDSSAPIRQSASQFMRRYLILELVDKTLSEAWWSWTLAQDEDEFWDRILSQHPKATGIRPAES